MGETITFRLDRETGRILQELRKRNKTTNSEVIRSALRTHWRAITDETRPTSWEIYQQLYLRLKPPRKCQPLHDRARHVKQLIREKLLAKRREGTL